MTALKKSKRQEIPFILDGQRITKSVSKNTTCSDVINKLPKLQTPLAVFESVDGIEKELTGKTKLLKIWRANGPTRKVEFVIRKSEILSKIKKSSNKISSDIKMGKQPRKELSKDTLKQVSDLAFYVRYQKTKLQALEQKSDINSGAREQNRLMRKMTSNSSVNSMDAFLAKADLNEMANFLTFCGTVTAEKLSKRKRISESAALDEETASCDAKQTVRCLKSEMKNNKGMTIKSLKSTKLGFKQKFAPKKTMERTTSTGTLSSTDTGYHSNESEYDSLSKTSATSISQPKRPSLNLTNLTDIPRHSTPVIAVRTQKHRAGDIETTFNADTTLIYDNLEQMNEIQGKSVILQRFMADQILQVSTEPSGNDVCDSPDVKRRRMGQYNMPAFKSQTDVCRFLWDNNCDSDSDCESEISEPSETLDMAFNAREIDYNTTFNSQSRTLRRESAISNLNRFSLVTRDFDVDAKETLESQTKTLRRESAFSNLNRFSLLSRDTELDSFDESNGFDYSFDCSFPRMDETKSEDFSMDFSCDYDESDIENESMCNEDDSMDNFMKTRSLIDISGDVTTYEIQDEISKSCFNNDESIGSMIYFTGPEIII